MVQENMETPLFTKTLSIIDDAEVEIDHIECENIHHVECNEETNIGLHSHISPMMELYLI